MDEWFVKKKGLAFGVMWVRILTGSLPGDIKYNELMHDQAGTGLGGVIIPILLQFLLNKYGFRTTLRIWSAVLFVATAPLILYLKPRLPIAQSSANRKHDFSFLKSRTFLILQAGNVFEGLGYFVPSIYLPTYAKAIGASNALSALTLILFNVASVFGCIGMGGIIDRWHVTTCIMISTIGSTLSVFLIWGFSNTLAPLFVFCILYGFFAGSFSSTYPGIMMAMEKRTGRSDSTMIFAMLAAGRGIGNVLCGPISEALFRTETVGDLGLYNTEYGPLVLFTGLSAALGGVSVFGRMLRWI